MPFVKTQTTEERFWEKVDKGGDCWLWTAGLARKGYGEFWLDGKTHHSHRIAWMLEHGEMPAPGYHVHHSCENKRCVNPAHLELKTPDEHWELDRDGMSNSPTAVNARKTHCNRGHALDGENVIFFVGYPRGRKSLMRKCRTCERARQKQVDAKRKAERHARKAAPNSDEKQT